LLNLLGEETLPDAAAFARTNRGADAASTGFAAHQQFGDYELLEEIARGGMGVVYRARQKSLDRIVAVKVILAGRFAGKELTQRFRGEAAAAGTLQHPNIVAIHDIGMHEGQHFFSMDYIEGQNLAQFVKNTPLPAEKAARDVKLIAEAIHYAHQQGILHRDLKPSNILIDANDQPRVTDFGLAKRLDGHSSLTMTGQVLGSPNFMPPEQASDARGKVGRYSDVYGLGAILYYLLTARAPFQADTLEGIVTQVLQAETVAPRLLNASVSPDLETICLKCLEKEANRRYQTAQELADELGRFLSGEPITARPVTRIERAWRWCKRKPALASSLVLALILLLVLGIGAPIAVFRTNRARSQAEKAGLEAVRARAAVERSLYVAEMNLASQAVRDGAVDHARELLKRHLPKPGAADLRGFEWRYLWRATEQGEVVRTLPGLPSSVVVSVGLVRVGDTLYNLDYSRGKLRAWSMTDWTPLASQLPSHPGSDRWFWHPYQETALAVDNTNRSLTVYQLPGLQRGQVIPLRGLATQSAISPDRRLLAVCFQEGVGQRVAIWDLLNNTERTVLDEFSALVCQLEFSNDGTILAVPTADGVVSLWDVATWKRLPGPPKIKALDTFVRFAPGGRRFVYWNDIVDTLHVWDPAAGVSSPLVEQCNAARSQFSPDGELLAMEGANNSVQLVDMKSNRRVAALRGHQAEVRAIAFSPNGRLLASAGWDRTARLWDLKTERELATLGGHEDSVYAVAFSADGERLVTFSANGVAKVWDVPAVLGRNRLLRSSNQNFWLRMSADERLLASADIMGTIHVWDLLNRNETFSFQTDTPGQIGLTFAPQGHRLAWASPITLGLVNLRSRQTNMIPIQGNMGLLEGISFSPDSQEIMFSSHTNVLLCELPSFRLRPFARCQEEVYSIAYSPDGTLLAFGLHGGAVSLWERKSGRKLFGDKQAHAEVTATVEFSPDGKWLASCGTQTIQLWHVQRDGLTPFGDPLHGHASNVPSVAFSPDGMRLASVSSDNTLKLWDTAERIELGTLYGHRAPVSGVIFSRDGNRIYSTGMDGDVRVWEAPPLSEIALSAKVGASKSVGRDRTN
jgi:WD40 repeat protein/predicted Ser/Thr protein kinase